MNRIKLLYWSVRRWTWELLKEPAARLAKLTGHTLLNKPQTIAYLSNYRLATLPASRCILPEVRDVADPSKIIHREERVRTAPSHVWQYTSADKPTVVLPCGLLKTGHTVLNTDYWNYDALPNIFRPKKRSQYQAYTLLAPLGHYFDGDKFVGYYDFIFLIAAKLCRLKEYMPDSAFREAVVAYPLVHATYEREFLQLMGFGPDRIFDSRLTAVHAEVCYIGSHDNWMHQNLGDILLLKKHLEPLIQTPRTGQHRIYISRVGRRRVLNEAALIDLLTQYGFTIIEDKPRSLTEQYAIYHNASFIIGPHGASFTNLLWCEPGTQVLELFAAQFAPTHFVYLSELMGLRYSAYCQDADPRVDYAAISANISVSIPDLQRCLDTMLGGKTSTLLPTTNAM